MKRKFNLKNWLLDAIYPDRIKCIFCDEELNDEADKECCQDCGANLPYIFTACPKCGNEIPYDATGVCDICKRNNYSFDQAVSTFAYEGKVVRVVQKFKFEGCKSFYLPMSEYMCETFSAWDIQPDLITFVPMMPKKQKLRGYNQAELLARKLAQTFNIPCAQIVEKVKDNQHQVALNYQQRQQNIVDSFAVKKDYLKLIRGLTVLLIDDVFTTGATTNEISKILKSEGVSKVFVLTFAHTLLNKD